MKFTDNYIKNSSQPIHLVQCEDERGNDCFYFLMCPSYALTKLKNANEEVLNINDYGVVVHSGYGVSPTIEDIRFLESKYGYRA